MASSIASFAHTENRDTARSMHKVQ